MLQLRVALPVLAKRSLRPVSTSVSAFGTAKDEKPHLKDDTYELLPPGASMKEPSYDFGCVAPAASFRVALQSRVGRGVHGVEFVRFDTAKWR